MGIEYFVSEKNKNKTDLYLKLKIESIQKYIDKKLIKSSYLLKTEGFFKFKKAFLYLVLWLSVTIITGIIVGKYLLSGYAEIIYSIGIIVSMVLSWFFVKHFFNLIIENILVFLLPSLFRIFTTFILFIKKGAIAGLGIFILLLSFECRYYNSYYIST